MPPISSSTDTAVVSHLPVTVWPARSRVYPTDRVISSLKLDERGGTGSRMLLASSGSIPASQQSRYRQGADQAEDDQWRIRQDTQQAKDRQNQHDQRDQPSHGHRQTPHRCYVHRSGSPLD